jgi:glutathione synthase/RimK-type ligase-like ATP-grasp enzyme
LFDRDAFASAAGDLSRMMRGEPFLVQQFVPEIGMQGEISFIYFNGSYSHAALKRPATGDFRVQKEFGGSAEPFVPPAALLEQADGIANAVSYVRDALYCRVDAVERNGKLVLMELELIEPELFLRLSQNSAERFAHAIVERIGGSI